MKVDERPSSKTGSIDPDQMTTRDVETKLISKRPKFLEDVSLSRLMCKIRMDEHKVV